MKEKKKVKVEIVKKKMKIEAKAIKKKRVITKIMVQKKINDKTAKNIEKTLIKKPTIKYKTALFNDFI